MKKLVLVLAIAAAVAGSAPVWAGENPPKCYDWKTDCKDDDDPKPVPEPSGFVQLGAGLFVLGGLALAARKRFSGSEVE